LSGPGLRHLLAGDSWLDEVTSPSTPAASEPAAAPAPSSSLTAAQSAEAKAAAKACKLKVDSVAVELEFSVQKDKPDATNTSKPLFKIDGAMKFAYPCKHGEKAEANAKFELNIGDFSIPDFTVTMVFYCGVDGSATEPVFELKGSNDKAMKLGPVVIEQLNLELVAYTYAEDSTEDPAAAAPAEAPAAGPGAAPEASLGWWGPAADAGAESPGPSASNDTDTNATATKKPIHVAGILTGYIVANLTEAQLGHPALMGLLPEQVPGRSWPIVHFSGQPGPFSLILTPHSQTT
jgi:hypothetical protein